MLRDEFIERMLTATEEYARLGDGHRVMGPAETRLLLQLEQFAKEHRNKMIERKGAPT
jgi:hypothetical protein